MTANKRCTMPIGVRFNRRPQQPMAHLLLEQTHIVRYMVQVNERLGCMTHTVHSKGRPVLGYGGHCTRRHTRCSRRDNVQREDKDFPHTLQAPSWPKR